jgi:hypothetical protein
MVNLRRAAENRKSKKKKKRNRIALLAAPNNDLTGLDQAYIDDVIDDVIYVEDDALARLEAVPDQSPQYHAALTDNCRRHQASQDPYQLALREHQRALPHLIRLYENARQALAECVRVDEVKDILDKAEALRACARILHDHELEIMVSELKLNAYRRMGEMSADLETAPHGPGRGNKRRPVGGTSFKRDTLKRAGISPSAAHRAERVARIPQEEFDAYITECRKRHQPVRLEEMLRSVTRTQQLRPLRRSMDFTWDSRIIELLGGLQGGKPGPRMKAYDVIRHLEDDEAFIFILMVVAEKFSSRSVYTGFNEYQQLLLRLLQGDFIEAVLRRVSELIPEKRRSFLKGLMKHSTELENFSAVDWSEVTFGEREAEEEGEEISPTGEGR